MRHALVSPAGKVAKLARQRVIRNDTRADLVGDENQMKIQLRQLLDQLFDFFPRIFIVVPNQKIADPKSQTIHQRAVGFATFCQQRFG